jgi:hypothetical protein
MILKVILTPHLLSYGQTQQGTTAQMHGGYSVEGHEAGDDCAQVSVQPWV